MSLRGFVHLCIVMKDVCQGRGELSKNGHMQHRRMKTVDPVFSRTADTLKMVFFFAVFLAFPGVNFRLSQMREGEVESLLWLMWI